MRREISRPAFVSDRRIWKRLQGMPVLPAEYPPTSTGSSSPWSRDTAPSYEPSTPASNSFDTRLFQRNEIAAATDHSHHRSPYAATSYQFSYRKSALQEAGASKDDIESDQSSGYRRLTIGNPGRDGTTLLEKPLSPDDRLIKRRFSSPPSSPSQRSSDPKRVKPTDISRSEDSALQGNEEDSAFPRVQAETPTIKKETTETTMQTLPADNVPVPTLSINNRPNTSTIPDNVSFTMNYR